MRFKTLVAVGVASVLALAGCSGGTGGSSADKSPAAQETKAMDGSQQQGSGSGGDVGVFTWWAEGSEKLGLEALTGEFAKQFPNDKFVNLAVAGGAGSNAKAKLAADLENNNPPDSFQGHAGAELFDYIVANQLEPVNDVIDELGGSKVFPESLLGLLTVDGNIYSVPSNVHRSNVVWANPEVLAKAGLGKEAPASIDAWLADMEKLKAAGVETPLSVGTAPWTQLHLFESILLAEVGTDDYNKLFTDGDWKSDKVKSAIEKYAKLLSFANSGGADDWPQATDMVIDGKAAYNVMGDWAVAQFTQAGKADGTDYIYFPTPGTDGTFLFLADSFTLPKGAKNPAGAKDWLRTVGSAKGQEAFNMAKGSIPARTDVAPDNFPAYQQSAMKSFKNDKIASSIAHGAAAQMAWSADISSAVSKFWTDKDTAAFHDALVKAAESKR
ncbi:ABC transporter substrate-binding protein [Tessaracoccus sp. OH4464_COT-324]|uniref:ABC transporter substrate-binding protein n=1 Tax=Tessaracoccus sp. OH4464_COT-324 TaxID=2491059 RepID=UPI000F63F20E|nr:extracellular solute-binding protein [Tessaracoccus sp. OH4464_COT-324]RRD47017.1 extracellular solute-binding protein [Tessaracoccus sp. OH4464_COT-324]